MSGRMHILVYGYSNGQHNLLLYGINVELLDHCV